MSDDVFGSGAFAQGVGRAMAGEGAEADVAAAFAKHCRDAAGDLWCVIDTNRDRGPFVAEWSIDARGIALGNFRVRLVCGRKVAVVRVFSGSLGVTSARSLSQALSAAAAVGETFGDRDCGGTMAEVEAAHRKEDANV